MEPMGAARAVHGWCPGRRPGHHPLHDQGEVRRRYLETPQKWGQISVVGSTPESAGEAMLYV